MNTKVQKTIHELVGIGKTLEERLKIINLLEILLKESLNESKSIALKAVEVTQ